MDEESPGHHANLAAGFAAGSWLGGYRLEQQVGAGGMAVVFRARDERLDRLVALKIMTPTIGSDDMFRQRFIRESRAAESCCSGTTTVLRGWTRQLTRSSRLRAASGETICDYCIVYAATPRWSRTRCRSTFCGLVSCMFFSQKRG